MLLALHPHSYLPPVVRHHQRPIEGCLGEFCAVAPRRGFNVSLFDAMLEEDFEPEDDAVALGLAQYFEFEYSVDLDCFLVGNGLQVEGEYLGDLADDQGGVDDADHGLMRDPLLHRCHRDAVDVVPVFDFVVVEVLVVQHRALVGQRVGEHFAIFNEEAVPGFDHAVEETVEVHAVAHGFCDDDVDFRVELIPTHNFDVSVEFVFLNDFVHHVDVLHFAFALSVDDAVDQLGARSHREDGVQQVDAVCQVQHRLALEQVLVLDHRLVVGVVGDLVLHSALEGLEGKVVHLREVRRESNAGADGGDCGLNLHGGVDGLSAVVDESDVLPVFVGGHYLQQQWFSIMIAQPFHLYSAGRSINIREILSEASAEGAQIQLQQRVLSFSITRLRSIYCISISRFLRWSFSRSAVIFSASISSFSLRMMLSRLATSSQRMEMRSSASVSRLISLRRELDSAMFQLIAFWQLLYCILVSSSSFRSSSLFLSCLCFSFVTSWFWWSRSAIWRERAFDWLTCSVSSFSRCFIFSYFSSKRSRVASQTPSSSLFFISRSLSFNLMVFSNWWRCQFQTLRSPIMASF